MRVILVMRIKILLLLSMGLVHFAAGVYAREPVLNTSEVVRVCLQTLSQGNKIYVVDNAYVKDVAFDSLCVIDSLSVNRNEFVFIIRNVCFLSRRKAVINIQSYASPSKKGYISISYHFKRVKNRWSIDLDNKKNSIAIY